MNNKTQNPDTVIKELTMMLMYRSSLQSGAVLRMEGL